MNPNTLPKVTRLPVASGCDGLMVNKFDAQGLQNLFKAGQILGHHVRIMELCKNKHR